MRREADSLTVCAGDSAPNDADLCAVDGLLRLVNVGNALRVMKHERNVSSRPSRRTAAQQKGLGCWGAGCRGARVSNFLRLFASDEASEVGGDRR